MTTTDTPDNTDRAIFWSSRVLRRALLDGDGSTIGVVEDILLSPALPTQAPVIRGFVARVDRRQIFVHQARVDAVGRDGVHLRGGTVDLRHFKQRSGEILVATELVGTATPDGPVTDVGFVEAEAHDGTWTVEEVATGAGLLRRRTVGTLPWSAVAARFQADSVVGDLERLRDMHKADAATAIRAMSDERPSAAGRRARCQPRLADVLEELPEDEQVEIIGGLETEDAVAVLDEMETDDEIDLLKELPAADREELLAQHARGRGAAAAVAAQLSRGHRRRHDDPRSGHRRVRPSAWPRRSPACATPNSRRRSRCASSWSSGPPRHPRAASSAA